ncbi:hypothetical protein E1B28_005271 [Marasmius oreades]|uniref:Extracellular metalloproteinase n=1 Tax=Marasmius oreades TaxID=181124 RepID=A0A9P7V092_9AGAR|nr:uncharacterized protein E1B28_005271 [Marasmius oreades]KAG7097960.1 hypothetical protein E1B28_005271 [Marasmius oreades]
MATFNKFFSSVFLAVLYASSYGNAAPWPTNAKHGTHRVRTLGKGVQVEAFHPPSSYKTYGAGVDLASSFTSSGIEDKTVSYISSELQVDSAKVTFKSGYTQNGQSFAYAKQVHNGIPVSNAVANVAFKDNKVIAFGHSFVDTSKIAPSTPSVDVNAVIPKTEEVLEGKKNEIEPTLEYHALADGSVALAHVFQVQNDEAGTWYKAFVDAHTGDLISVTDYVADASYKVLPVNKELITDGLELVTDPQNTASSPSGWHSDGKSNTTDTSGNNVVAYKGSVSSTTKQSADNLVFDYTYDTTKAPDVANNVNAARTNAFYLVNSYHDTLYQYGFTEASFNFQNDNFGKGGAGNDRIRISVQDASGTDNADFATPPDGQSGQCRMFIWTATNPKRDGVLENDIPLHEVTHGLTNRMTGGGTGECLQSLEAGGMGEGWSDIVADWFSHSDSADVTDFIMGQYVTNDPAGIRSHPYSTSASTNPLRYSDIAKLDEVHNIGEVRTVHPEMVLFKSLTFFFLPNPL